MTVLSRILGNFKTKPKTPEEQLADLAQLPMSSLIEVAVADESVAQRLGAIARLDYGPTLIALAFEGALAGIQQGARRRLAALLDNGLITLEQLSADGVEPLAQLAVVGFCEQDGTDGARTVTRADPSGWRGCGRSVVGRGLHADGVVPFLIELSLSGSGKDTIVADGSRLVTVKGATRKVMDDRVIRGVVIV